MDLDTELALEYGRKSLTGFIALIDPDYIFTPLHKFLIEQFERALNSPVRLALSMPPRHGKSRLISQFLPAYVFGRRPKDGVIAISYSATLSHRFGAEVRQIMSSPTYKLLFPDAVVAGQGKPGAQFGTVSGGEYLSAGVGGSMTGFGCRLLLIDDPIKNREDAFSPRMTQMRNQFFGSTAFTRIEPGGSCIILHTRWSKNDLIGYVLENVPDFEYIRLPAIAEEEDPLGRNPGEALFPERFTVQDLKKIEESIGYADFQALYQQNPVEGSINLWKPRYVRYAEPTRYNKYVISIDAASELHDKADYTAIVVLGCTRSGQWHQLETIEKRIAFPDLVNQLLELEQRYPRSLFLVEKASNGIALLQYMTQKHPNIRMQSVTAHKNKKEQFSVITPMLEEGQFLFTDPSSAYTEELIRQLEDFGNTEHDDLAIALVQALYYFATVGAPGSTSRMNQLARGERSYNVKKRPVMRF